MLTFKQQKTERQYHHQSVLFTPVSNQQSNTFHLSHLKNLKRREMYKDFIKFLANIYFVMTIYILYYPVPKTNELSVFKC